MRPDENLKMLPANLRVIWDRVLAKQKEANEFLAERDASDEEFSTFRHDVSQLLSNVILVCNLGWNEGGVLMMRKRSWKF